MPYTPHVGGGQERDYPRAPTYVWWVHLAMALWGRTGAVAERPRGLPTCRSLPSLSDLQATSELFSEDMASAKRHLLAVVAGE